MYIQPLPPLPPTPPINVLKPISAGSQVSAVENNILGKNVRSVINNKPILRHETNSKALTNRLSVKKDKPVINKKSPTIEPNPNLNPNTPSSSSLPSEKKSIKASGNSGVKLIHTPPRNRDTFTPSLQPNSPANRLKVKLEVNNDTSLNTPTTTTAPSSNKIYSRIEFLKKVAVQFIHIPFPNLVSSLCDYLNILYLF
jgi:hypothetical protein